MTRGEARWLAVGIAAGIVASVTITGFLRTRHASTSNQTVSKEAAISPSDVGPKNVAVQLSPLDQERIGVETVEVRRSTVYGEIVAPGRVEELETAVRTISSRSGGRVERLLVDTGQQVTKGQPVARIYTQELATARESPVSTTIYSDSTGVVRSRNATEGQFVVSGAALYVLIDMSSVSVRADIFSSDISQIRPGLRAEITSEALSGIKLQGSVKTIDSRSDGQSGTTPVHILVENPGMQLRPGMFVRSAFQPTLSSRELAVPRSAVIDSGNDKAVYLSLKDGVFQRRVIRVGPPGKDYYPVVAGLMEGDKVVIHGGFLIDSQTRLSGGLTNLFSGSKSFDETARTTTSPVTQSYRVTFETKPAPPQKGQDNNLLVTILDSVGNPIHDAQVRTAIIMPAMPSMGMPEMRSSADLIWNGSEYAGSINIGMAGPWNVVIEARRGNQLLTTYQTRFDAR